MSRSCDWIFENVVLEKVVFKGFGVLDWFVGFYDFGDMSMVDDEGFRLSGID